MAKRRGHGEGSIYQRKDGRWTGVVDLGFVDGKRKRKHVYATSQESVIKKINEVRTALDTGLPLGDERLTVGQFLDRWLADVAPRTVGEGSLEAYERRIRLYVKPALGRIRLRKLSPTDVERMMNDMEKNGLAPSTIDGARKVLVRALRRAMVEGHAVRNVAALVDGAGKSKSKATTKKRRSLTLDQAKVFMTAIKQERLEAAYVLTLTLGVRRGETLGIAWSDVDLEAGRLAIRQQLQRRKGKGLVLTTLKTQGSERELPLPPQVVTLLRAWKKRQAEERLIAGPMWANNDDLVFTTPKGTPVDPDNFRHRFATVAKDAGLGKWTLHELRHSAGSLLFAMGIDIKVIAEILGHSSDRVTREIYVHTTDEHRAEALNAMSAALWGA